MLFSKSSSTAAGPGEANGCPEPQALLTGAGLYCVKCHASAIANSGTFSLT